MERIDLLVIGAGLHGLAVAKAYAESTPHCTLAIVDAAASIGGVWARERLYPGLKTNNVVGSYEFSDFPMDLHRYRLAPGQHIPGHVVHQYLVDFADHFHLTRRVRLQTQVDAATLGDDGAWRVEYSCSRTSGSEEAGHAQSARTSSVLVARHIAVATGLTSEPHMPVYPGQAEFKGHLFHAKELNSKSDVLRGARNHVVVVGANKSAWDVCYMAAQQAAPGATVHMLIRPSGRGPSWIWRRSSGSILDLFSISRLTSTRLFAWLDPSPLEASPARRVFLRGWLGRLLCAAFWALLDYLVLTTSAYVPGRFTMRSEGGLAMLRPWYSTFWMGNSLGVHNFDTDWFEFVRSGRIVVHHAEVEDLLSDDKAVRLSDGEVLKQVDVVVACTGWEYTPSIRFTPSVAPSMVKEKATEREETQEMPRALASIRGICPAVLTKKDRGKYLPPFRLYRFMVPLWDQHHSLACVGFYQSLHTALAAQAQGLWITAFFQGALASPVPDAPTRRAWTYLNTEYQQLRRLGSPFPDLVADAMPYIDLLLADVGLASSRKGSWWRDLLEPHGPRDYRGLGMEWDRLRGRHPV